MDLLARRTKNPDPDNLDVFDQVNNQPMTANMDSADPECRFVGKRAASRLNGGSIWKTWRFRFTF